MHWRVSRCGCARFRTFAVMLADQVTARQIERVDRMERDDERYPTTLEGSVRLIDSYGGAKPQVTGPAGVPAPGSGPVWPIADPPTRADRGNHDSTVRLRSSGGHLLDCLTSARSLSLPGLQGAP